MTDERLERSLAAAMAALHPDYVDPPPPAPATLDDVVRLLVELLRELRALHRDVEP